MTVAAPRRPAKAVKRAHAAAQHAQRLARLTLVFAVLFAVFIIAPAFLNRQFAPYPLLKVGDILDLFTPLVIIPLYWRLFQLTGDHPPQPRLTVAFMVLAALWVEGQGLHLAANAIGHLSAGLPGPSDVHTLTVFVDEVLSHYLWHLGLVGLSALLLYRQWQHPLPQPAAGLGLLIGAGVLHGLTYFLTIVEAATGPLGVPFAVAVVVFTVLRGRDQLRSQPLLLFFFVTFLTATLLFLGWGLYWRGLPEFSQVGLLD
jgi:hypothetical protein